MTTISHHQDVVRVHSVTLCRGQPSFMAIRSQWLPRGIPYSFQLQRRSQICRSIIVWQCSTRLCLLHVRSASIHGGQLHDAVQDRCICKVEFEYASRLLPCFTTCNRSAQAREDSHPPPQTTVALISCFDITFGWVMFITYCSPHGHVIHDPFLMRHGLGRYIGIFMRITA